MVEFHTFNFNRDKEQVVSLINENLNPSYSEKNLLWKHYKNPYQISNGAVAIEDSKIIACVFYMAYNIQLASGKRIKAARPVDGCTAINYRGKGIFKRLISYCLDRFHYEYEFLFANPNQFSFPEFLKMDWLQHQGYSYYWGFIQPKIPSNKFNLNRIDYNNIYNINTSIPAEELEFITWRFEYKKYKKIAYSFENSLVLLIYRVAKMKGIKTVIVCYYHGYEKYINKLVLKACNIEKTYFIYFLLHESKSIINCIFKIKHKNVVIVTKPKTDMPDNILFTLADLEGTT